MLNGGKQVISHAVRDVANAITAFSARIGADHEFNSQQAAEQALKACCTPQNITVIGLTGSGKSSILDALAGDKFCALSDGTDTVTCWHYGPTRSTLPYEWARQRFYPADCLLNLEFRDTVGLEDEAVQQKLNLILLSADVIPVVIKATDGINPALWDYLETLNEDLYPRMVLTLTHAETLSYEQAQALKETLRATSKERLGIQLPLYPVTPAGDCAGEGVEALRIYVQEQLKARPMTDGRIKNLLDASSQLLNEQEEVLKARNRLSRLDTGFLSTIDHEIDRIQIQMEDEMPARLKAYADYVQENVSRLGKKSARQLGRILSIRRSMVIERFPAFIDEWFYEVVRAGVEQGHGNYNKEFLNICRDHWDHVRPRVKEQWNCDIGEFPAAKLQTDLDEYKKRLGCALYKPLRDFGIKPCLANLFREQGSVMHVEVRIILVLIMLAGLLGSFGENPAAFACLGLTLVIWLCCNVGLAWMGYKLNKDIVSAATDMHIAVECGLSDPLYQIMINSISDYRKLYLDIHKQVAVYAEQLAPLTNAWYSLFYKLEAQKRNFNRG